MTNLTLTREDISDAGCFGVIKDEDGNQVAVTCERPDNGNQPMGCIPVGTYRVMPFTSPHLGRDFQIQDVPDRSMIEMHSGNTIKDTEGCIIVGESFGVVEGLKAVVNSRATLAAMLQHYADGFTLEITE